MNCISCKNDIMNNKTGNPYNFKLTNNGNCILGCPDNFFLTDKGDCVSECPSGTYQFSLNYTCLYYCPNDFEINKEQNKCIKKSFEKISSSEFKDQISKDILALANSSNVINGSDFIAVVLSSDDMDPKEQLKKGISAIDLGNCTDQIKEYYNISKNESLFILNMESKKNDSKKSDDNSFDLGKNIQIEIFDNAGRKLNLSVCKEDIKVMKFIGDVEELNIESAMNLADKGIDVFNASDDFFNNICHKYNNTDGKDIIINDRRTEIYQNVSFCQKGCTYTGMNYELMTANCICDSSTIQNYLQITNNTDNSQTDESVNFNSLTKSVLSNLFDFNLYVINCYNLVLDLKILSNNIGFYCMVILLIIQIICLLVYLSKKLKSLKYVMLICNSSNPKVAPPKNNTNNNSLDDSKDKKLIGISKKKIFIKSKFDNDKNKKKYNLKNIKKENVKTILIDEEINSENNSRRKLQFMEEDTNKDTDIILKKNNNKNKIHNINIPYNNQFEQSKAKGNKNLFLANNFSPIINIQTPVLNINNNKTKRLPDSEREKIDSKNQTKDIKLDIKNDINNNKLYSKKLTIKLN